MFMLEKDGKLNTNKHAVGHLRLYITSLLGHLRMYLLNS